MNPISFHTPVIFGNYPGKPLPQREKLLTYLDRYLSITNRLAFLAYSPDDANTPYVRTGQITKMPSHSLPITVIKIISYMTIILPLLAFLARCILRLPYVFTLHTPSSTTLYEKHAPGEFAMPILPKAPPQCDPHTLDNTQVLNTLKRLYNSIKKCEAHPEIVYTHIGNRFVSFEILEFPGVIFKTIRLESIDKTKLPDELSNTSLTNIASALGAQRLLLADSVEYQREYLDLKNVFIPKHKGFIIKNSDNDDVFFITEEKLPLYPDLDTATVWNIKDEELRPAFVDLARLINKTHICDIKPDNCSPICIDGKWMIALVDLELVEEQRSAELGTWKGLQELMSYLNSEESLTAVVKANSMERGDTEKIKIARLKGLQVLQQHQLYHRTHHTDPSALNPITMNEKLLHQLGLDLTETNQLDQHTSITMKEAILQVIDILNKSLKANSHTFKTQSHFILLPRSLNPEPSSTPVFTPEFLKLYSKQNTNQEKSTLKTRVSINPGLEIDVDQLWLHQILDALLHKGLICSWGIIGDRSSLETALQVWL